MIETRRLKNVVIFIQTILSFVLSRKIINEMCFNEGLVMFDKEMEVFSSKETPERKLQLVWDKI